MRYVPACQGDPVPEPEDFEVDKPDAKSAIQELQKLGLG